MCTQFLCFNSVIQMSCTKLDEGHFMHFLCALQAANSGHTECIKVLLQGGAGINLTDNSNLTALHHVN